MAKKKLKLEFNYRVRDFVEPRNGAECREITLEPAGDVTDLFSGRLPVLNSLAISPLQEDLSIAAMSFKEAAVFNAAAKGEDVTFAKKVRFTNPDGETIDIEPATFTPYGPV